MLRSEELAPEMLHSMLCKSPAGSVWREAIVRLSGHYLGSAACDKHSLAWGLVWQSSCS